VTSSAPSASLTPADLRALAAAGISADSAEAQLRLLRGGMSRPVILRPCTLGDGIEALHPEEFEALGAEFQKACAEGRWVSFIPASGAATRMAASLADPAKVREMAEHPRFGESSVSELLKDPGEWAEKPKALMPFHASDSGYRTPVEEHAREAAALAPGSITRLHFTISPEHERDFVAERERVLSMLRGEGLRAEITHSFQDPATQTLALDAEGNPFRDAAGNLLLRPGGHGSLLRNLEAVASAREGVPGADFVWVRNIDNIPVEVVRAEGRPLRRALGGLLMRAAAASPKRPARVVGMVKNAGEPGGGPFWIEGKSGPEIRIVESAEVNPGDAAQAALFRAGTHFNPVDLCCALRDARGEAFRLEEFADPSACFVADKAHEGRPLRALEWPGLWNGAMAGWSTRCVEIPLSQFAPVKTVADLLRPEHLG
jgi:hypothetical protein